MSELVLLGLVERAETVLHAQAEGLSETIVGWNLEYCQYIKFSSTTKSWPSSRGKISQVGEQCQKSFARTVALALTFFYGCDNRMG